MVQFVGQSFIVAAPGKTLPVDLSDETLLASFALPNVLVRQIDGRSCNAGPALN